MGRHRRSAGWVARSTVLLIYVVVLVLLISGMAYAAFRYEQSNAGRILPGVRIANVRVGGLTRPQAIRAVSAL